MAQHIGKALDHSDGTRTCTKCGERQPLDRFDKVKSATLGRRSDCKQCRSVLMRALYRARREEIKARVAQHRADNVDAVRAYDRLRSQRPDRKELHAERIALRRAQLQQAPSDAGVTRANLRIQYGDHCFYCAAEMSFVRRGKGDPFADNLATIDHVHPITLGGGHTWDNVVLACWRCNVSKKHTPLTEWIGRSARS